MGNFSASCCGINLIPLKIRGMNKVCNITKDEIIVNIPSPMIKDDYISFVAYVTMNSINMIKLYPEGSNEVVFLKNGHGTIYYYDINKGLYFEEI